MRLALLCGVLIPDMQHIKGFLVLYTFTWPRCSSLGRELIHLNRGLYIPSTAWRSLPLCPGVHMDPVCRTHIFQSSILHLPFIMVQMSPLIPSPFLWLSGFSAFWKVMSIMCRYHRPSLTNKVQPAAQSAKPAGKPPVFSHRKFQLSTNKSKAKDFSDGSLWKKK